MQNGYHTPIAPLDLLGINRLNMVTCVHTYTYVRSVCTRFRQKIIDLLASVHVLYWQFGEHLDQHVSRQIFDWSHGHWMKIYKTIGTICSTYYRSKWLVWRKLAAEAKRDGDGVGSSWFTLTGCLNHANSAISQPVWRLCSRVSLLPTHKHPRSLVGLKKDHCQRRNAMEMTLEALDSPLQVAWITQLAPPVVVYE